MFKIERATTLWLAIVAGLAVLASGCAGNGSEPSSAAPAAVDDWRYDIDAVGADPSEPTAVPEPVTTTSVADASTADAAATTHCVTGYERDADNGKCVKDTSCDGGYVWDLTENACVEDKVCDDGFSWDVDEVRCVEDEPCAPGAAGSDATCRLDN